MEAEDQYLAIDGVELHEGGGDVLAVFKVGETVKGCGIVSGYLKAHGAVFVATGLKEFVEAGQVRLRF